MLRYILSWSASSPDFALATLDVTAAFLNAPLPPGRIVVLRPPTILHKLQLLPPGHVWLVHKAIHGLREAPNRWSEQRTESMTKVRFHSQGERYCVLLSEVPEVDTGAAKEGRREGVQWSAVAGASATWALSGGKKPMSASSSIECGGKLANFPSLWGKRSSRNPLTRGHRFYCVVQSWIKVEPLVANVMVIPTKILLPLLFCARWRMGTHKWF